MITLKQTIKYQVESGFFTGHFIEQPIVPGVVWLIELEKLIQNYNNNLTITKYPTVKFTKLIKPEQLVNLEVVLDDEKISAKFNIFDEAEDLVATGKLELERKL